MRYRKSKKNLLQAIALIMFVVIILTNTVPLYAEGLAENAISSETDTQSEKNAEEEVVVAEIPTEKPTEEAVMTPEETQAPEQPEATPEAVVPVETPTEMQETPQPTTEMLPSETSAQSEEEMTTPEAQVTIAPEVEEVIPAATPADTAGIEQPTAEVMPTATPEEGLATQEPEQSPTEVPSEAPTEEPSATPETELTVIESDKSVVVTGICKADGEVITDCEEFEIMVDDVIALEEEAPLIEGYTFAEKVTLDNGDAITQIKKEITEEEVEETKIDEETGEESLVTAICKTTSMSYFDGTDWVELTGDITVVFEYKKDEPLEEVVVLVDATILDEFGDTIAEEYTNMELPEFENDELVLNDTQNPPVENVQISTGFMNLKKIKYTYVQAKIDKEIIKGLKREAAENSENADEEAYIYYYTTDGENWTKIIEDTTVIFEYSDGKKTVYTYEDSNIMVTATLQHANAIPDDAQFVVTQVTSNSSGYNYDAYMEALNENADKISDSAAEEGSDNHKEKYTEENTLLYDIAFLCQATDDEGNVIEGQMVEYQPAEGMVNISFDFKRKQLENKLEATSAEDVAVVHLPLVEEVKEASNTTAEATDISATDVKVEVVADSVAIEEERVDFNLSNFSLIAFVDSSGNEATTLTAGPDYSYLDALGDAVYYGIVADEFVLSNHADTNIAVKYLSFSSSLTEQNITVGKDTANNNKGINIVADVESGKKLKFDSNQSGTVNVWCTTDASERIEFSGNSANSGNKIYAAKADLENYVESMLSHVDTTSADLASKAATYGYTIAEGGVTDNNNAEIDISGYDNGTYYINVNQDEWNKIQNGGLKIKKNSTQTIVLNFTATEIRLRNFVIEDVDTSTSVGSQQYTVDMSPFAETVIFNIAGDANVVMETGVSGTILAPNANVTVNSTSSGWLVAETVANINAEWHCVWDEMPTVDLIPIPVGLKATKTVEGNTPSAEQVFTFVLEKWNAETSTWDQVEEVNNTGSEIVFSTLTFSAAGDHYYRVSEKTGSAGYNYDTTNYIVKVVVSEYTTTTNNVETTSYSMDSFAYYKGTDISAAEGSVVSEMTFNNTLSSGSGDETVSVAGNKTWYDEDSAQRPDSITIKLIADGEEKETKSVTASDNWSYTFTDLPKYDSETGNDINYTIEEAEVSGYTATVDGYNVINVSNTNISVTKQWEDSNDLEGFRPDSVVVELLKNDIATGETLTLSESNSWSGSFEGLPQYDTSGNEISYSIAEAEVPDGYTSVITGDMATGFTVTNTYTVETVEKTVTKEWEDADNANNTRPASITVQLKQNDVAYGVAVTLNADNNWSYTWTDLPKNKEGEEATYTVEEISTVAGYETTYSDDTFIITNTLETVDVPVTKEWNDSNNQDGIRPDSVTVKLLADGEETTQTIELFETNSWEGEFTDLPKYDTDGEEIAYIVEETDVPEGYDCEVTGDAQSGYIVTNTHETAVVEKTVTKVWEDADNANNTRPASISVQLMQGNVYCGGEVELNEENNWTYTWTDLPKNANGTEITYTVKEISTVAGYITTYSDDSFTITNTLETVNIPVTKVWEDGNDQDGLRPNSVTVKLVADGVESTKTIVLTKADGWASEFTDLPKCNADGSEIVYTVIEADVPDDYSSEVSGNITDGFTITNSYTPGVVNKTVKKEWVDAENANNTRPASISVQLKQGTESYGTAVELNEGNNWTYTWNDLPKIVDGSEVNYTVEEISKVAGYTTTYSDDSFTITNTLETVDVPVTKVWEDSNNQDGIRPDNVTIKLVADDEETTKTIELSETNSWTGEFTDLPKYDTAGEEITYTVEEAEVPADYDFAVTGTVENGYVITNTHEAAVVEKTVTKEWEDADNANDTRPTSISVQLKQGEENCGVAVELNEENGWTYTWTNLPKNKDGVAIAYSVEEISAVPGYETTYSADKFTITNTLETVEIPVTKVWEDGNDQDGLRPDSVTVKLVAGGEETEHTITLNEGTNWTGEFINLPKCNAEGVEIEYTVMETDVPVEYVSEVSGDAKNGYTITNTYEIETVEKTVTKEWEDTENANNTRPESISVQLKQGEENCGTAVELNEENGWTHTWTDLPKNANGTEIVYTVEEISEVPGYTVAYSNDGFTITNTLETVDIPVTKVWEDSNDQDGLRPDSVTIKLIADGEETEHTITVTEDDNWTDEFTDLPKYNTDGSEIVYTVMEADVPDDYISEVSGNVADGFVVTNSYTPGIVHKTVKKEWVDNDNEYNTRPASISVQLKQGNESYGEVVELSDENDWTYTWDNLPKTVNGDEATYTVTEISAVAGYETTYSDDGFTIINTLEMVDIPVTKEWEDGEDQDGLRPDSITIKLFADGEETPYTLALTEENDFEGSFEGLPKYNEQNEEIVYTIQEVAVAGYAAVPEITGDAENGFVVTNKRTTDTVSISGEKVWDDNNDKAGERPDSITVVLLADGEEVDSVEVTADDNWKWSFTGLDKNRVDEDGNGGVAIVYTIEEVEVEGYVSVITGDLANGYIITNTYEDDTTGDDPTDVETTTKTVRKIWDDKNNQDGIRPASIKVQLLADGENYGSSVTLKEGNSWRYTWKDLPVEDEDGNTIEYTVKEISKVTGYTTTYSKDTFLITNKHKPETTAVNGVKIWDDDENKAGKRPDRIVVNLYADGVKQTSKVVMADEDGDWTYSFSDLPKYKDGKKISYTVTENKVQYYKAQRSGYNLINTYVEPTPKATKTPKATATPKASATPKVTATPKATATPSATPAVRVTPRPIEDDDDDDGPRRRYTPKPEIEVDVDEEVELVETVLGASRVKVSSREASVLGVRRGLDMAVLGRRRRPVTGDSIELLIWILVMSMAAGSMMTSSIMLFNEPRRKR